MQMVKESAPARVDVSCERVFVLDTHTVGVNEVDVGIFLRFPGPRVFNSVGESSWVDGRDWEEVCLRWLAGRAGLFRTCDLMDGPVLVAVDVLGE